MSAPSNEVEGCRLTHIKLRSAIADLTDEQVGSASLLPGWTVGHVLAHLAQNADGMSRRIDAALCNEVAEQYAGGLEGRAAAIEAGAARGAREMSPT